MERGVRRWGGRYNRQDWRGEQQPARADGHSGEKEGGRRNSVLLLNSFGRPVVLRYHPKREPSASGDSRLQIFSALHFLVDQSSWKEAEATRGERQAWLSPWLPHTLPAEDRGRAGAGSEGGLPWPLPLGSS